MMFSKSFILLSLAISTWAAPLKLAQVKRAADILGARQASPDSYIVSIKSNTVNPDNRRAWLTNVLSSADVSISQEDLDAGKWKWDPKIFNGLSVKLSSDAVRVLQAQDEVNLIHEDIEMYISAIVTQEDATWGVSRFSQGAQSLPAGSDPLGLNFPYTFDDEIAGQGTDVYVVDTGVRVTHQSFGGRAQMLISLGSGVPDVDINGHGTHVAGSAAGNQAGIAKGANIFGVKVMGDDGSGATSDIIAGIEAAFQNIQQTGRPSVINMSLGGPGNEFIDQVVSAASGLGVPFVVAAGNESQDALNVSPARLEEVITVGATNINDELAGFSNFGPAVDILAPGEAIVSLAADSDTAGAVLSGTSMASPHVAGLAAVLMQQAGRQLSPAELKAQIVALATRDVIQNLQPQTVNLLATSPFAN